MTRISRILASVAVCGALTSFHQLAHAQETLLFGLPNCQELAPGALNLHWELSEDGKVLDLALEGVVQEGDQYLAFGFSPPGESTAEMVGSHAVIAGNIGDEFFGQNYFLSGASQCISGNGVCPESTQDIEVVEGERNGNVMAIHMKRGIGDWPIDGSQVAIWATGAVEGSSSIASPGIQYHGNNRASPGSSATVAFNEASNTCSKLV